MDTSHYLPDDTNWIFRPEHFGGLIHSRQDGVRYQVPSGDAIFFEALRRTGQPGSAAEIVRRALPGASYVPDIKGFEAAGVIVPTDQSFGPVDMDELALWASGIHSESQSRTWLRAPVNLSLYPIMACKAECGICFVRPGSWLKGLEPAEKWIGLMQEAHAMGVPFLSFLGGDASHYPAIHDLVSACDTIGIKATLTTIGLYMPDTLFHALVASRWVTPTVSLQSLDHFHTSMTGWAPEASIQTLKRLIDAGKDCRVNLVWSEQSFEQILDVLKLCIDLGVTKMSVGVFFNINHVDVAVPTFPQYRQLYERVLAWLTEHHPGKIEFTVEGCQLYTAYPELERPVMPGYEWLTAGCEAGNGRGEVFHDGALLPCALLERERWADVNAFDLGLRTAWDTGRALKLIRSYRSEDKACSSCSFGGWCNGGCPAMNEVSYGAGNITTGGDVRCQIRDKIIVDQGITPPNVRLLPVLTSPATHKGRRQVPISTT